MNHRSYSLLLFCDFKEYNFNSKNKLPLINYLKGDKIHFNIPLFKLISSQISSSFHSKNVSLSNDISSKLILLKTILFSFFKFNGLKLTMYSTIIINMFSWQFYLPPIA